MIETTTMATTDNVWIVSWLFHVNSKQVPPKKSVKPVPCNPANLDFATLEVVIGWIYPPKDTSHHQDCMCLVRESQPKPSFATEKFWGPGQTRSKVLERSEPTIPSYGDVILNLMVEIIGKMVVPLGWYPW